MARWNRLAAFFLLFICLQFAVAHVVPVRRQDSEASSTAITSSARSGTARNGGTSTSPVPSATSASGTVTDSASISATITSSSALPTISDSSNPFDNSSLFNTTIPEGQLPLEPKITPGFAVAGVILLCAGVVYSLIGIKNPALHNTFSVAYVVGLGITVLVVYLMPVPVSNGSQGGYVVAAILPGILVGVGATWFFNEITECFACALGGFCLSMWLLCLQEGGLLSGISKTIFIIVLTLAAFATYFTRWTRDWALMATISFTGATSTVLGIDCFSRAGLKEFWVYIWHLNDNIFPVGATTYPLTKGIKVEIAAIIVLFCIGIISQKRLWNVIKDHRAKKQEEVAEERRARDEEEANIGKKIEAETARERRAWERVHGDHDSGFARDSESEKGLRYSQSNSTRGPQPLMVAEMQGSDVPPAVPPKPTSPTLVAPEKEKDGLVTVRVAPDEGAKHPDAASPAVNEKGEVLETIEVNAQNTPEVATNPVPEVVPLPFRYPAPEENTPRARASTVATFADEDEEQADVVSKRSSFAKRLSQSSANLMRKVSQRTSMSRHENGPTEEELAVLRQRRDDDDGSIAATIDTESDSGASTVQGTRCQSIEVAAQLAQEDMQSTSLPEQETATEDNSKHTSTDETLANEVSAQSADKEVTGSENTDDVQAESIKKEPCDDAATENDGAKAAQSQKAKSTASANSTPVSLTKERLPPSFSNVALHYRTNEWAKHLSHAETPVPETLQVVDYPEDKTEQEEVPAPLNVEELQQTALTATPAPAPTPSPGPMPTPTPARSTSQYPTRGHSRNSSYQSAVGLENPTAPPVMNRQPPVNHRRVSSKNQVPTVQTITEESIASRAASTKSGSSGRMSMGFERPPPPPGVVSYDSPQSLIAQRSAALRNKTYGILTGANTMPDFIAPAQRAASESGSLYNYSPYPSQAPAASYDDDMPLSQRKELIRRQSSLGSMIEPRSPSGPFMPTMSAENIAFDSHQPSRYSNLPSLEAREARLASFRNSVRADLRSSTAVAPAGANGRDMSLVYRSSSSTNLAAQAAAREADLQRNIDLQRSFMMSQKEAEAKRRERERLEKERAEQAFTRSMQTGEMFDLHRDAMRRMQQGARNA